MVSMGLVWVRVSRFFVLYFMHLYSVDGATESFDRRENIAYALYYTTVVRIAPALLKLKVPTSSSGDRGLWNLSRASKLARSFTG